MKMIARLSRVALAGAVLALPMAGHAALANLVGWSGWTHQVYVGAGGGFQYTNLKTRVDNTFLTQTNFFSAGFNNHRYMGIESLSLGLANSMAANYWAAEFDAYYTSAQNNSYFNSRVSTVPSVTANFYMNTSMPWRYEVDGILGHYFQPNVLGYVKAGPTMGRLYTVSGQEESTGTTSSLSNINKILYGVNIGAGAQYVVNAHWRLGGEADFVQFFNAHISDPGYAINGANQNLPAVYQFRGYDFIAKATVNYLF